MSILAHIAIQAATWRKSRPFQKQIPAPLRSSGFCATQDHPKLLELSMLGSVGDFAQDEVVQDLEYVWPGSVVE